MEEGSLKKVTQARREHLERRGKKYDHEELEDKVVHWIYEKRNKMLHVSRKMMSDLWKAKRTFDKKKNNDPATLSEEKPQLIKKTHPTRLIESFPM